jgi:hypothetical protein
MEPTGVGIQYSISFSLKSFLEALPPIGSAIRNVSFAEAVGFSAALNLLSVRPLARAVHGDLSNQG